MHSGLKSVYDHTHTNEKKIHKIKYKILQNSTAMFIYIYCVKRMGNNNVTSDATITRCILKHATME